MSRTDLITLYQGQHRYDCFEIRRMDRDRLIAAILAGEARQDQAKPGSARQARSAWSRSAA